jgi:hypothetical protein
MDLAQLLGNLLLITFLGLLVAFNPMLIVVDILLVLKSQRPILNTVILSAGFVTSIALLFSVASQVIDPQSQISLNKLGENLDIPPFIDIFAGLMLLAYSVRRYTRKQTKHKAANKKLGIPQKPYQLFMFGFIKAALSVTNLFAILILARISVSNDWNIAIGLMAVLWLVLIGVIPLAAVVYYHQFKHESLISIDKRINRFLSRDTELLITYILASAGAIFIAKGTVSLIQG